MKGIIKMLVLEGRQNGVPCLSRDEIWHQVRN